MRVRSFKIATSPHKYITKQRLTITAALAKTSDLLILKEAYIVKPLHYKKINKPHKQRTFKPK